MAVNNPYIQKVQEDSHILTKDNEIYSNSGKWTDFFGNTNPTILEIGTGMGNFFGKIVSENKDKNFIGMEIRYKRLYQTAEKSRQGGNDNFILLKDFGENIDKIFSPGEVFETYIFFPDPWEKKDRQRKHRLMQKDFLEKLHKITKSGGRVVFKSDHREYFDSTVEIIKKMGIWSIDICIHDYEKTDKFDMKNITSFEAMYRGENKAINYLELVK